MFQGLRTVIYHVEDLEKAKEWYSKALKIKPYFDKPFYVGFNVGGYELGLDPDMGGVKQGNAGVAYWGVPDAKAAFKRLGRNVEMPQPGGGALRELGAAQADHDGRMTGELFAPLGGIFVAAPDSAGNQPRIGGKIRLGTDVDQHRRVRRADEPCKFIWRYRGVG